MQRLTVNASGQYDIHIGNRLLQSAGELLSPLLPSKRVMVVSDDNVFPLWGDTLLRALHSAGFSAECFIFPAGETSKNTGTYLSLLRLLSEKGFTRADGIAPSAEALRGISPDLRRLRICAAFPTFSFLLPFLRRWIPRWEGKRRWIFPREKILWALFISRRR